MTSRAVTAGLGAVYMAASAVAPLILKTTPSDLDLYFWPSAETVVSGHPLLIYAAHAHDVYPNANGPLGLVPLIPIAALANALGWAGSLAGRAALAGAVVSLAVLLLAYQTLRLIEAARGRVRWPLLAVCTVVLAPGLWIAVLDYGHVEQPVELCFMVLAIRCFLGNRKALTGVAFGAAVLTRTIAGFCALPLLLVPAVTGRLRVSATIALAAAVTIVVVMAPFFLADAQAVTHSLLTYRGGLPIGSGSFWITVRDASWAGVIRTGDVYVGLCVAIALLAVALRRNPTVARTHAGLAGLLTVASCCFPLFAKTVFPYYLLEPYVFAVLWWLSRPGNALNWRAVVPLLLTLDVFILKAATSVAPGGWGAAASVVSSTVIGLVIGLVTLDLLRPAKPAIQASVALLDHDHRHQGIPAFRMLEDDRGVRSLSAPGRWRVPTGGARVPMVKNVGRMNAPKGRWLLAALLFTIVGCSPAAAPIATTSAAPATHAAATAAPSVSPSPSPTPHPSSSRLPGAPFGLPALPPGVAFTGKLLIADRGNGRIIEINPSGAVDWVFPRPGQHLPVPFGAPDDAFYTANGTTIIANAEGRQTVTAIDRATGTILWQVGHYNVRSSARGYFNEPDDAVPQPDGTIWVADIRNCRLVHLSAAGAWLGTIGNRSCRHNPPSSFAEPNGAFPTTTGSLIVTEIGGSWVTDLVPGGSVAWSVRAPVRYPSDAMQMPGGSVLLTDYSRPGAVVRLSSTGRTLWHYRPTGRAELNHTSIAIPLASNRIAICDDFNSRIIVVDPATNQVIWTFTGSGASRLFYPDGIDYEPPQ